MNWKLLLIEFTCQLIAHVMYLGDEDFFSFPLALPEESPIRMRMTLK